MTSNFQVTLASDLADLGMARYKAKDEDQVDPRPLEYASGLNVSFLIDTRKQ